MADLKIVGNNVNLNPVQVKPGLKPGAGGFDAVMKETLGKVVQIQNDADLAVKGLASGGDVTEAVIAMQKAEMSFQVMVEVRNKLIDAYHEIMRMPV